MNEYMVYSVEKVWWDLRLDDHFLCSKSLACTIHIDCLFSSSISVKNISSLDKLVCLSYKVIFLPIREDCAASEGVIAMVMRAEVFNNSNQ